MARITTLLVLAAVLALCQAIPVLVPTGKEIIYDYHAKINVGTFEPATFASQFMLNAKLHMQKLDDKHVIMKLTDMTYKLFNGDLTHEHKEELTALPLAEEVLHDLMEPFVMTYDEHGQIQKIIFTDKKDRKFSRDMKKGIGSLMQLDMEKIKLDTKEGYAFKTMEDSVYGNIHVRYHVMPEDDEMVIEKMLALGTDPRKWKAYIGTTDDNQAEKLMDRDPLTIGSHRTYTLAKKDNTHFIKEITSQGNTYLTMMKGKSEAQVMLVNQDLTWTETSAIKTAMAKPTEPHEETLHFELGETEEDEALVDLSFGRNTMKMEEYEKLIYTLIEEGMQHMKITHLKMETPDMKMGQWMHRLMRVMSMLDLKTMEHMFVTMEEKTGEKEKHMFEVFQLMTPLIGTRASVLLMRNLIRKQKIPDGMAMTMLIKMPFHLRMPSEKLLTELEDMIHMENVNTTIQRTATLTFASMVHKVFNNKRLTTDDTTLNFKLLEKYIEKFMDLLKNAKDYTSQYLYMNALYNIRLGGVQKHLEPFVTGEATTNRHLRYLAMCASFAEVIKHPDRVFELYWPIFADTSLHLELRAAAYLTIMGTRPSKNKLMHIYWVMKKDPCPELYHLHWSNLRSLQFTTDKDLKDYRVMVTELMNFMREPMHHTLSGRYMMDYKDPNFGFGSLMSATFMSTNTSKSMYFDFSENIYNLPVMDWALWLKIDGMDPKIMSTTEALIETLEDKTKLEQLISTLMSMKDQKNLHFEYAILKNDKIIMMDFADHSTIENLQVDIMTVLNMDRDMELSFEQVTQVIIPNDMGLPTVLELVLPTMSHTKLDTNNDEKDVLDVQWKNVESSHNMFGMSFFNPIADIWQGIKRLQVNEMMSSLNLKLTTSKDMKMKLTINNQDDETMDKFAVRNYATNFVYVYKDLKNELQKSSKTSEHFTKVTRGEDYRHSKIMFEHDCPHTGLHFQIGVFDTKKHVSRRIMMEMWHDFTQRYFKNYQTMPLGYMLLTMNNAISHMMISPEIGTFGFMIRATPSKKYPVNHIDITMRAIIEHIKDKDHHLPNTKFNTRFTLATKTKDNKMIRSWDTNAIMDMNPGHTLNNYKIHLSMETPEEKQFKMCVVGMRKWNNNKVIGHLNITMGHTDDAATCVDNEGFIEIDMKGELSDEQQNMINKKLTYDECLPTHMHEPILENLKVDYEEDFECTLKQTSLRKFEYDFKMTGMSEKSKEIMEKMMECMKGWMMPFYSHEKSNVAIDDHTMKVVIDYPIIGHEMNMEIMTPKTRHMIKEAPTTMMRWMGFRPESYHYTYLATWMHNIGMADTCMVVDQHLYTDNFELIEIKKEDDWMKIIHNNPDMPSNHSLDVFVKRMEGTKDMGLRMKFDDAKIMEILPEGEIYKITWDGKPLTIAKGSYHDEDIFSIGMMHDKHNTLIMRMYNFGLYIDYDGEQIRMAKSKMSMRLTGLCYTMI